MSTYSYDYAPQKHAYCERSEHMRAIVVHNCANMCEMHVIMQHSRDKSVFVRAIRVAIRLNLYQALGSCILPGGEITAI